MTGRVCLPQHLLASMKPCCNEKRARSVQSCSSCNHAKSCVIHGQSCLLLPTSGVCASFLTCSVPVNMETTLCWAVQLAVVSDVPSSLASRESPLCCRIALMEKDSMWVWKRDKGKGNQGRSHLTQRPAMPLTSGILPRSDLLIPRKESASTWFTFLPCHQLLALNQEMTH
jgi:hypothetical protein